MKKRILLFAISAGLFFTTIQTVAAAPITLNTIKNPGDIDPGEKAARITVVKKWEMPDYLKEISGLAYMDGDRFACVQDEAGTIFIYNTATSSVEKEISFAPRGDYEGLAVVDQSVWIVRSDGHLFEVRNINSNRPVIYDYDTPLTAKQNVEGLCYDKNNNRLLLAIKDEEPGNVNYKGVYGFDLASKTMAEEPVFKLDLTDKLLAAESGKKNNDVINPSGIAVHPSTGNIYITDGTKSKLLITDPKGNVKAFYQLSSGEFTQPEGIAFKPDGELFISNEGNKQSGNIVNVVIAQ